MQGHDSRLLHSIYSNNEGTSEQATCYNALETTYRSNDIMFIRLKQEVRFLFSM